MISRLSTDELAKLVPWDKAAILDASDREVDENEIIIESGYDEKEKFITHVAEPVDLVEVMVLESLLSDLIQRLLTLGYPLKPAACALVRRRASSSVVPVPSPPQGKR